MNSFAPLAAFSTKAHFLTEKAPFYSMRRWAGALTLGCMVLLPTLAQATAFTAGNVVVNRAGNGSTTLSSAAAAVSVVEISPSTGTVTNTINLPTFSTANQGGLTDGGSSGTQGDLNLSPNGQFLSLTGYDAPVGTASITGTTSTADNRTIAEITNSGSMSIIAKLTDAFSANNTRAAITDTGDGTTAGYYLAGNGDFRWVNTATGVPTTSTSIDSMQNLSNGALIADPSWNKFLVLSSAKTAPWISYFAPPLPTTTTATPTTIFGGSTLVGPTGFLFLDLNNATGGLGGFDTVYVVDTTAIKKFTWSGTAWVAAGTITGGYFGITGKVVGGNVVLYATTTIASNNSLVTYTDTSGSGSIPNGAVTTAIASAGANYAFRGVAFSPLPVALTTTGTLGALSTSSGVASSTTTFTVAGTSLTGNVTVIAPTGFEVSATAGSGFGKTISLTETSGTLSSTTVYVRLAAADSAGTYSGNVVCSSPSVTSVYVPTASSTVTGALPSVAVSGTASALTTTSGTASTSTSFQASGSNLTANITVTAPTGFEVSTTSGSGYAGTITLTQTGGTVPSTTIYVRLAAATLTGTYSGNVIVASNNATPVTEAIPSSTVTLSGTFAAGNLVVEQLANQTSSSTFWIVEVNPALSNQTAAVDSYSIPSTGATALRQSSAGSTGRLASSNDGTLLAFTGFEDPTGVADETSITTRGAASLSQNYTYALQATYTDSAGTGDQTRGATYNAGTWYMSDKNGLWLNGASAAANSTNTRPVKSFGGTVYALSNNTTVISSVSANGTTYTGLIGLPTDANAVDFYMLSSGVNGSAFDILYVNDGTTVNKYSLVNGSWVSNGSAALGVSSDGLCASSFATGAYLYVSSGSGNTVVKVTDAAAYNVAPSITTANNVTLYTAASSAYLKGVAFAPLATALPDLTIAAISNGTAPSFSYTLTLANSGAANATGVTANFTLPAGLTYVSATDNGGNGFTAALNGSVVKLTGGTLNANSSDTITISVTGTNGSTYIVDAGTSPASGHGAAVINTSATTSSPIAESNSGNNGSALPVSTTIAPPSINETGSLSALSTSYGIASGTTSFSVSGTSLEANILVTAPTGFEMSFGPGSNYATSLVLMPTNGTVSPTTIYVRLAATTPSGSYGGNIVLSSTGAASVNEAIPTSTVTPSANLSSIGLSSGSLTQALAPGVTSYTDYVPSSASSLTVTPVADNGATVQYQINGVATSNPISLSVGSNVITIAVTDGGFSQTYTVTVIRAGAFTPGDVIVSTYGNTAVAPYHPDGETTLITLEEFAPTIATNSKPVMAVVLPGAASGNNVGITGEYGSSSEGTIQPTSDGLYLTIGGYSAAQALAYTATATAQSPCATVPRVAALIDLNSNCDTSSVFNDIYNTNNPRCVYSPDDVNLYLSGQGAGLGDEGGLYYTQVGTNTTTGGAMPTGLFNVVSTRTIEAYQGNLYYSADQNSSKGIQTGIFEYTGLPTTSQSTNTGTRLTPANDGTGGSVNYSPDAFFFANATTLYVADTGDPKAGGTGDGGIQKWLFDGAQWNLAYTLRTPNFVSASTATTVLHGETGFEAMAVNVVNGVATIYAVSYTAGDADSNGLYAITDTVSATTLAGQTFTEMAAAPGLQASGTNPDYNFKGVSFAPTGSPVNAAAASNVTATGATLNASVNPNGVDTIVYFQYGTPGSAYQTTTMQDIGTGSSAVPISIPIPSGLQASTTYNYQLVTVANGLTSTYALQTFTTASGTATPEVDSPTMPTWGLILLAMVLVGMSANWLKPTRRVG